MPQIPCPTPSVCGVTYHRDITHCIGSRLRIHREQSPALLGVPVLFSETNSFITASKNEYSLASTTFLGYGDNGEPSVLVGHDLIRKCDMGINEMLRIEGDVWSVQYDKRHAEDLQEHGYHYVPDGHSSYNIIEFYHYNGGYKQSPQGFPGEIVFDDQGCTLGWTYYKYGAPHQISPLVPARVWVGESEQTRSFEYWLYGQQVEQQQVEQFYQMKQDGLSEDMALAYLSLEPL